MLSGIYFIILQLIFVVVTCFVFNETSFASSYLFEENFDELDRDKWKVYGQNVSVLDGWLNLSSETSQFPFLSSSNIIPENFEGDFEIEIRFKYDKVDNWGNGITLGNLIPPYPASSDYAKKNNAKMVHMHIWQDSSSGKGLKIKYHHNINQNTNDAEFFVISHNDTNDHIWKIIRSGSLYSVFVDQNPIFERENSDRMPTTITVGNPFKMYEPAMWSSLSVDHIRIMADGVEVTPPLIIIPGLGGSWNTEAMVYGESVGADQWQMTPFVNIYDRLAETVGNNGYARNENLFVWNYDWRKPIPEIAVDLNQFINSTPELESAEKIDLVGHSLGGLVVRTWTQDHDDELEKKTNKLIAVGSPHYGAVQAYSAIVGGKVGEKVNLGWLAMQLLLQIHKDGFETNAALIKEITPVLNDIIPTFDFIEKYGRNISVGDISYSNQFLPRLNQEADILSFSHFILGNTGLTTPEWLVVKNRSLIHEVLDLWPDGQPIKTINGFGDGTVLKKSAFLENGYNSDLEYSLNHHQIISDSNAVKEILELLGKSNIEISGPNAYSEDNLLVFYLASPATLKVNDSNPETENLQFIVIPDPETGTYQAEINGVDDDIYHLYLGQITPSGNFWQVYEDEIQDQEVKHYEFNINFDDPLADPLVDPGGSIHLNQAKELLENLYQQSSDSYLAKSLTHLNQAIENISEENWSDAVGDLKKSIYYLARFRKAFNGQQINPYNKAKRIMEIITLAWEVVLKEQNMISRNSAYQEYRQARSYYSLAMRLIRLAKRRKREVPTIKGLSVNYSKDLIDKVKIQWGKSNYSFVEPHGYLARLFAWEGLVGRR